MSNSPLQLAMGERKKGEVNKSSKKQENAKNIQLYTVLTHMWVHCPMLQGQKQLTARTLY